MIEATVDTVALRVGLKSVLPHVSRAKERAELANVRCTLGAEHLMISASDGITTAATVMLPVVEHGPDGEIGSWDLAPSDAKDLLTVFKGSRRDDDTDGTSAVRFRLDGDTCQVQDVGGLWDGKTLTLASHDVADFPDIPAALAVVLRDVARPKVDGFQIPQYGWAKFGPAAAGYGSLDVFATPRAKGAKAAFILRGGRFIGLMKAYDEDADMEAALDLLVTLPAGGQSLEEALQR